MNIKDADKSWLDDIEVVGGHPALDFVNTVHSYTACTQRDYLRSAHHLVDWCRYVDLINNEQTNALSALSASAANTLLSEARDLRATLNAVFRGHLAGRPDAQALDQLNVRLKTLAHFRTLDSEADGYVWRYEITRARPHSVFTPIVFAAAELLQAKDLSRLKSCPPPAGCGWLFLDRSRNGSRTWCNMKTCGNAAKQRRHRARYNAAATRPT